jgi:hypothetical protein
VTESLGDEADYKRRGGGSSLKGRKVAVKYTRFDFEFAFNPGTAKTPGLEVPPAHFARLRKLGSPSSGRDCCGSCHHVASCISRICDEGGVSEANEWM